MLISSEPWLAGAFTVWPCTVTLQAEFRWFLTLNLSRTGAKPTLGAGVVVTVMRQFWPIVTDTHSAPW